MTGRLWIGQATDEPSRHVRLVLPLDDGSALFFQDQRRFGACRLLADLSAWVFYASLGPEPLDLPFADFDARLGRRSARIKALLLDQTVIAGIGNIYADESLFAAGIRPDAKACDIPSASGKNSWPPCKKSWPGPSTSAAAPSATTAPRKAWRAGSRTISKYTAGAAIPAPGAEPPSP
jgi:formamidopyrimidine-DNA glycosylase